MAEVLRCWTHDGIEDYSSLFETNSWLKFDFDVINPPFTHLDVVLIPAEINGFVPLFHIDSAFVKSLETPGSRVSTTLDS